MSEPPESNNDLGSLERARERLYTPGGVPEESRPPLTVPGEHDIPHAWESRAGELLGRSGTHIRAAGLFFIAALLFFIVALGISAYLLYFGGNAVSVNNVSLGIQGPITIAGGDTLPLSLAVTNRNSVPLANATLEVDFPRGHEAPRMY
ncbi:hypothetical protein HY091_03220 [Candidatus Kaiserbacteria bacterium]|nr:hypothetical protein [Candidatus Kaiserbacteria bacterium]